VANTLIYRYAKNQYVVVLKIAVLLAVLFAILSSLFDTHETLSNSGPILTALIHVLFVIQGFISMMEAIDQLINFIQRYTIKVSYNHFLKPLIYMILSIENIVSYVKQLNQTFLSLQVMRC